MQGYVDPRVYPLYGLEGQPVDAKSGAEGRVVCHHCVDSTPYGVRVTRFRKFQCERHVIGCGTGMQLFDKPDPALLKRHRESTAERIAFPQLRR